MKRLCCFLLSLFVLCVSGSSALALPRPSEQFYVTDNAGILSAETKEFIMSTNMAYQERPQKPQLVVLTVQDMEGLDYVDFGVKVFEEWKIGNKEFDNGVLLFLAVEERKVRVEVGYGLEGALPDGKVGRILDFSLEKLKDGEYDEGLNEIFTNLAVEINKEYGYEDEEIFGFAPKGLPEEEDIDIFEVIKVVVIILVFLIVFIANFRRRTFFGGFGGYGGGFSGGGGFGGGGFGGGSGGGGFSGGGGRSGGGGAGRGF